MSTGVGTYRLHLSDGTVIEQEGSYDWIVGPRGELRIVNPEPILFASITAPAVSIEIVDENGESRQRDFRYSTQPGDNILLPPED